MPDNSDRVIHVNPLRSVPGMCVKVLTKCMFDVHCYVSGIEENEKWEVKM